MLCLQGLIVDDAAHLHITTLNPPRPQHIQPRVEDVDGLLNFIVSSGRGSDIMIVSLLFFPSGKGEKSEARFRELYRQMRSSRLPANDGHRI